MLDAGGGSWRGREREVMVFIYLPGRSVTLVVVRQKVKRRRRLVLFSSFWDVFSIADTSLKLNLIAFHA